MIMDHGVGCLPYYFEHTGRQLVLIRDKGIDRIGKVKISAGSISTFIAASSVL